ncbi:MAG: 50S ribosomal protein L10 [Candidatus Doudnabacteria bacterium]|nr:50S ribosomal protein L10 [Candidatus Doudnabacteria bacterium]
MAITRKEKETTLASLTEDLKNAKGVVFTEYRGLTVSEMTKMRKALRAEKVKYQVVKITLLRKALEKLGIAGELKLDKPVAVATSQEEETTPARILKAAAKQFPHLILDGGIFQSQIVAVDVVNRLASLPSREQLMGQLLSVLVGPARGLVTVLSGNTRNLLNVLNAIREKK